MADKDEYDEDEDLLMVTGSRSKSAGKKRHRKASDSEDDDDERPARAQKPAYTKRRAAAADSDDDEDGMDEEERQKLEGMNELEREMYLFEREERLQRQREREQVLNQARKEQEQVEVRASSRRKAGQSTADSAIGKIAAAHAQREERAKKKQQEEEEKQEQRRREKQQQEEEQEAEEDEYEESEEGDEDEEELASAENDEDLAGLDLEPDEPLDTRQAKQLGVRTETYDEGTGSYEEAEERATLDDIKAITLKRSDLEAWHNEPFFEEDVRGCVLRVVNQQAPAVNGQAQYIMCRIGDIVTRNSYAFPTAAKNSRTRKWLHLDDLSGHGVFRHQMAMVSNSSISEQEYSKALAKAEAAHLKFITKGDVDQAKERLKHARNFKYDSSLVKKMLERKRAAGKLGGSTAQHRARLNHQLNLARQEGKSEDELQRIQEELDHLEQQQAAGRQGYDDIMQQALLEKDADRAQELASQLPTDMALALINQRNKKINNYKLVSAGTAKQAAQETDKSGARDVFARRHTQSKVYWSTKKRDGEETKEAVALPSAGLMRQGSAIATVSLLKGDKKNMDPAELIKVLDLSIDLSRLPQPDAGKAAEAMLPKRLLGLRWMQSVEKRQQELAGRSMLTLDDWKRKMDLQQIMK